MLRARDERVRVCLFGFERHGSQRYFELGGERAYRLGRWLRSRGKRDSRDRERGSKPQ